MKGRHLFLSTIIFYIAYKCGYMSEHSMFLFFEVYVIYNLLLALIAAIVFTGKTVRVYLKAEGDKLQAVSEYLESRKVAAEKYFGKRRSFREWWSFIINQ